MDNINSSSHAIYNELLSFQDFSKSSKTPTKLLVSLIIHTFPGAKQIIIRGETKLDASQLNQQFHVYQNP